MEYLCDSNAYGKNTDRMKYRLADAMKQCMKTAPVEKITVKEIVEACGITRQTFYRNFKDKYDLINWYFDKILLESFEHMGEGETIYEGLVNKFCYIRQEKMFFRAAFKNDDQNCLRDHDFQLILQFYTEKIEQNTQRADFRSRSIFIGNVLSRIDLYDCTVAAGTMERDTGRACITACCRDARRTFCYIQKAETFVK